MKTRILKKPVKIKCVDDWGKMTTGCNSESATTTKVEMVLLDGNLCDFYVTCNECGQVTNHKWFAIPGQRSEG